jgi:hypothetical protein
MHAQFRHIEQVFFSESPGFRTCTLGAEYRPIDTWICPYSHPGEGADWDGRNILDHPLKSRNSCMP